MRTKISDFTLFMTALETLAAFRWIRAGSLPLFLICLLKPGAFGGGDIKLMAGCGFFLGAETVWLSFLIAVSAGGIWALFLLLTGRADRKTRFPFGPFLCAGMALALVFKFP